MNKSKKYLKFYLAVLAVALAADTALAIGVGPFQFGFANDTLTSLVLLPLQLAGCG